MPTIEDLEANIDLRHQQVTQLLELTGQQEAAIEGGHMNELMRLLSVKQRLIEAFVQASNQFKADFETFAERPSVSAVHRQKNEHCNTLHAELMQREAACQSKLESSRDEIASDLVRGEGAKRAAAGYGQMGSQSRPRGGGLDLSQ
ncbi:FlgN protein [Neorhodopirellula lusitana]|uniref:FlgN protein n=1 Tax=Neorhodopirellula lusitana TaxID=445327 RepID=A0ABY1QK96_9BACT|nr:flagellar export chaperone FlgN [Neorhodopirellula lusitana]SMP74137.1 FlgN protein [Neorhodopirellula lusitana]